MLDQEWKTKNVCFAKMSQINTRPFPQNKRFTQNIQQ
jgi:hypothetical protein